MSRRGLLMQVATKNYQERIVAVGEAGKISYTTDAVTWTVVTPPLGSGINFTASAFSPELQLWVAVTNTSRIVTSPDGITWTERTSPLDSSRSISNIIWCPSRAKFIALSSTSGSYVITSSDGITWSSVAASGTIPSFPSTLVDVAGTLFGISSDNYIRKSVDGGATWTVGLSSSTYFMAALAYAPSLGRLVAEGGYDIFTPAKYAETHTTDLTSWSAWNLHTSPSGSAAYAIDAIGWSPTLSKFVHVAGGYTATSPDGVTWTGNVNSGLASAKVIVWAAGLFLMAGVGSMRSSPDGTTWTFVTAGFGSSNINQISPGRILV